MYYKDDYEPLEGLHMRNSETYDSRHPSYDFARSYLPNVHNLQDFHNIVVTEYDDEIKNEHRIQLMIGQRGITELKTLYWLIKYHSYTAGYGRIRFLLESYLILKGLNQNKETAKKKYEEATKELRENNGSDHLFDTLSMTDYLSGVRRNQKGNLGDIDKVYSNMYDHLSNIGSHPQSVTSMLNDGQWTYSQEEDLFQLGLLFIFGLLSQYVRLFSDTTIYTELLRKADPIFVSVKLTLDTGLPTFMKDDLKFFSPTLV